VRLSVYFASVPALLVAGGLLIADATHARILSGDHSRCDCAAAAHHNLASSSNPPASPSVQDSDEEGEEVNVPVEQTDKYIAVYSAMQRDHSLTVEQAAAQQGLSVTEFRAIEDKIERNPLVHQRVLDALRNASKKSPENKAAGKVTQ